MRKDRTKEAVSIYMRRKTHRLLRQLVRKTKEEGTVVMQRALEQYKELLTNEH